MKALKSPFPFFGGKSRAAPLIWQALGDVPNYVEPFAGSLAVLLGRPHPPGVETVNDQDSFICNVFRALQADPCAVAHWCDFPPHEAQQHAIHTWLVNQRETFTARLMGDPDYYDAQVAGRWLYGIACWIGGGWCSGHGPWQSIDGMLRQQTADGRGINRKRLHLGDTGRGVHRRRLHLGAMGVHKASLTPDGLLAWFAALQARLRYVRVCCGDWTRVLGPSITTRQGLTGVIVDPPYGEEEGRKAGIYAVDSGTVATAVREWCLANGENPLLRIVLCGYGTAHDVLLDVGWTRQHWTTSGGYGNQGHGRGRANAQREMLWCSPHCLPLEPIQRSLF